jgi:hypothetical protein
MFPYFYNEMRGISRKSAGPGLRSHLRLTGSPFDPILRLLGPGGGGGASFAGRVCEVGLFGLCLTEVRA